MTKVTSNKEGGTKALSPNRRRARSGYILFCNAFRSNYVDIDHARKAHPEYRTDNMATMPRHIWKNLKESTKEKFSELAREERPPTTPTSLRFEDWLANGRIDQNGNEVNPPAEALFSSVH